MQEIGQLKRDSRIPLRNFEVEANVKSRLRSLAEELGIDGDLGVDVALFLIRKAIELQSPIVDAVYEGDEMKIVVVGGMGGMGRWISRFLNVQGHQVRIHDVAGGENPLPRVDDLAGAVRWADLTIVAVPMSACPDVVRALASHEPKGIVAEMCSIKSPLIPLFEELRGKGLRTVSFHPMFGPRVKMLSGKQIVLCRAGHAEDENVVRDIFRGTSARIVEVDLAEHDRFMAPVLGMAHVINIGFANALRRFGIPFPELDDVSSVTFRKQVTTTFEVTSENPHLYYEIQEANPHSGTVLGALIDSFTEIRGALERKDAAGFEAIMAEGRAFFGEGPRE